METEKPLIIVTGAAGRVGRALLKHVAKDFRVVGLDLIKPKGVPASVEYLFTDFSSRESIFDSIAEIEGRYGLQVASVIHLVAYYDFSGGNWEQYEKITMGGTKNLLEALTPFAVEQFIYASSLLVYAPTKPGEPLVEGSPIEPKWEYPRSKVETEKLLEEYGGKWNRVVLRIAGVYDDQCHSIPIGQHFSRIHRKTLDSHFFPGNPDRGACFLHMDDLVQAIDQAIEKRRKLGPHEVFVLGERKVMTYADLQKEIGLLLHGKPWWTVRIPKICAKLGAYLKSAFAGKKESFIKPWMIDLADDHYEVDPSLAEKRLDWNAMRSLKKSLPNIAEDLKKNPEKWYEQLPS